MLSASEEIFKNNEETETKDDDSDLEPIDLD